MYRILQHAVTETITTRGLRLTNQNQKTVLMSLVSILADIYFCIFPRQQKIYQDQKTVLLSQVNILANI